MYEEMKKVRGEGICVRKKLEKLFGKGEEQEIM